MATTSMSLGPHWEQFLKKQVESGKYASVTDVVRDALRDMEAKQLASDNLNRLIAEGEDSGYVDWDPVEFEQRMRLKTIQVAERSNETFDHND